MQATKQHTQTCFNKAASTYDDHSDVQRQVGLELLQMIPKRHYATQLDLGCGTGWLTEKLHSELLGEKLYALDFASELLARARERIPSPQVIFLQDDFDHYHPDYQADLIYSNMALHWSRDLATCIKHIFDMLNHDGCFAFTLPLSPTFHELAQLSVQPFVNSKEMIQLLSAAGFTLIAHMTTDIQLPYANIREALAMIKSIGANHVAHRKNSMIKKSMINNNEPFQLTYHIGYFVVVKS